MPILQDENKKNGHAGSSYAQLSWGGDWMQLMQEDIHEKRSSKRTLTLWVSLLWAWMR